MELHIIFGPTATSKTVIAQKLWEKYHYPILSVDSRKVYKGADIGTNKLALLDFGHVHPEVLIGGIDFLEPNEEISVFTYQQHVYKWLKTYKSEIVKRGGLIIHGGTGLYLDAILEGKSLLSKKNELLRTELSLLTLVELQNKAESENAAAFSQLNQSDRMNPRRLVRVIENKNIMLDEKKNIEDGIEYFIEAEKTWHWNLPAREELYKTINTRVHTYYEQGWLSEVEKLLEQFGENAPALQMMGYRQLVAFMLANHEWREQVKQESLAFKAVTEVIQQEHRRYAKRQETWAKKYRK